jgi:hypothetical protein
MPMGIAIKIDSVELIEVGILGYVDFIDAAGTKTRADHAVADNSAAHDTLHFALSFSDRCLCPG